MIKKFDEIKELRFFYFPTPCCCWVQASTGTKVAFGFFEDAEVIHSYSRAEAIEDGVLVDLNAGDLAEVVRIEVVPCLKS